MNTDEAQISKLLTVDIPNFINASDAKGFASLHAEKGLWSIPNGPDITTRDGIEKRMEENFQKEELSYKVTLDEFKVIDDFAWATSLFDGTFKNKESGKVEVIMYRAMNLLKKIEGYWELTHVVWNHKPV